MHRQRPLHLGLSVGHPKGTTGSIGPFVRLRDGHIGFVSTGLVLAPDGARAGDYIHQPGTLDTDLLTGATRAGILGPFVRPQPGRHNEVDAAVVVLGDTESRSDVGNVVPPSMPDAGRAITGVAESLVAGDAVAFVGRTSGYSEGRIAGYDFSNLAIQMGKDTLTFDHCIEVVPTGSRFSAPGDSGALVWRRADMKAVGLVFAAAEQDGRQVDYLLPIDKVLSALDVHLL
jgi:hypothetical protein